MTCERRNCSGAVVARGLCAKHYARWRRTRQDGPKCSREGCDRTTHTRGLCDTHYQAWWFSQRTRVACRIDGCEKPSRSRGLCNTHLNRLARYGDPLWQPPTEAEQLFRRIVRRTEAGCWEIGGTSPKVPYGTGRANGRTMKASRASWIVTHGEIPGGLHVLHTCDNPPCINPKHLYLGTNTDNIRDRVERGRSRTGEQVANHARLSRADAAEIQRAYAAGEGSFATLGSRWDTSSATVRRIVRGEHWLT